MNLKNRLRLMLVFIVLAIVYFAGVLYYQDKFPSKVYINEINVGGMSISEANNELANTQSWDKLVIKSDTETFTEINADTINYEYVDNNDLPRLLEKNTNWLWFIHPLKRSEFTTKTSFIYKRGKVEEVVSNIEQFDNKLTNASIVYSEDTNSFIISPHNYEMNISKDELANLAIQSIDKRSPELNIEDYIKHPEILDTNKDLIANNELANKYIDVELKYDFSDRSEIVNRDIIKGWIVNEGVEIRLEPGLVREYVVKLADKYDTYGRNRSFKTTSIGTITTKGGAYGWLTHRGNTVDALIEHIKNGESKTIEPVYSSRGQTRNINDIGNSYVEIDLKNQMVYVYSKGELKMKTPTVTGNIAKGHGTPTGVDALNYKTTDAVLRGPGYASPVKYWMPFNGGIGLHDANWRSSFGGQIYKTNGSHGCINLPPSVAKSVYDLVYPGMPVIVY